MFFLFRPIRLLFTALVMESTPRQMALGLALGVCVGLVPKGNLLAIILGVLLAATRVNLAIAGFAIVICAFVSGVFDSVFDSIGGYLLQISWMQGIYTELANMPFVPWTDFNNSIVMGSFVSGLLLIWPVYRGSRPLFEKYMEKFSKHARRWWLVKCLLGAEWADRIAAVK
jgi:uncharacterized protein (TIGR03546 family)